MNKDLQISELKKEALESYNDLVKTESELEQYKQRAKLLEEELNELILKNTKVEQPKNTAITEPPVTIDSLHVSPHLFINRTSRVIKKIIQRNANLRGFTGVSKAADEIERFINRFVTYVYDQNNSRHLGRFEEFQLAEYTALSRQGDCEDFAILFQTIMEMNGYGNQCLCEGGFVEIDGAPVGHMYNRVLISGDWVVYDPTIGDNGDVVYPDMKDSFYCFNSNGIYKWL
jgi:hypothetical protein